MPTTEGFHMGFLSLNNTQHIAQCTMFKSKLNLLLHLWLIQATVQVMHAYVCDPNTCRLLSSVQKKKKKNTVANFR